MECMQILPKTNLYWPDQFFTHRFQFIYTPTVFGYIVEMGALSHPPQQQLKIKIQKLRSYNQNIYTTLTCTGIHINNPQNLTLEQRNILWYIIQNHFRIMQFHLITNTQNFNKKWFRIFNLHQRKFLFSILPDVSSNWCN